MDSIDVHPRLASMQVRNDCNAEVEVIGPVPELQIVARGSLAEQRLHNHAICCRRKTSEAERTKPLQEPASRDHGLDSRFQATWWQRKVPPLRPAKSRRLDEPNVDRGTTPKISAAQQLRQLTEGQETRRARR